MHVKTMRRRGVGPLKQAILADMRQRYISTWSGLRDTLQARGLLPHENDLSMALTELRAQGLVHSVKRGEYRRGNFGTVAKHGWVTQAVRESIPPGATRAARDIAAELVASGVIPKGSAKTAHTLLARLHDRGELERVERGVYRRAI